MTKPMNFPERRRIRRMDAALRLLKNIADHNSAVSTETDAEKRQTRIQKIARLQEAHDNTHRNAGVNNLRFVQTKKLRGLSR